MGVRIWRCLVPHIQSHTNAVCFKKYSCYKGRICRDLVHLYLSYTLCMEEIMIWILVHPSHTFLIIFRCGITLRVTLYFRTYAWINVSRPQNNPFQTEFIYISWVYFSTQSPKCTKIWKCIRLYEQDIDNNVCNLVTNCFRAQEMVILVFVSRNNSGNKHQKYTWASAEKVRHETTYIILFLTRHNESMNDDITGDDYASSPVSLSRFSFFWWRNNRLLMMSQRPDDCDAITWIVISNSLDIDVIHGDIHDRSCKNE